jgi:hypothetical protein
MLALAGIGVGVLGVLAAAAAWLTRPCAVAPTPRPAPESV